MKTYPESGILDLVGLAGRLIGGRLRGTETSETLAKWLQRLTKRYGSKNVVLNLLVRKLLLVTGEDLSAHIHADPPSSHEYVEGTLKGQAMAFLAPNALTISHDEQWQVLRSYNEKVLHANAQHPHQAPYLAHIHKAFAQPVTQIDDIRQRMGQVMLAVVFGAGNAPDHLIGDIQELFGEVGVRTAILGSKKNDERDQFYRVLRALWRKPVDQTAPNFLALAHGEAQSLPNRYRREEVLVQQIPHWMFTFTNSGSDLLGRSLAMITARPEILNRVRQEITEAGSLDEAATIHQLPFLEACILETGRLYPPVSQTVHKAAKADEFSGTTIAEEREIIQVFAVHNRDATRDPLANQFQPERWLDDAAAMEARYPHLFLSGARSCPGRSLILFVDKAAIAILLQQQAVQAKQSSLSTDPVPFAFPAETLQF